MTSEWKLRMSLGNILCRMSKHDSGSLVRWLVAIAVFKVVGFSSRLLLCTNLPKLSADSESNRKCVKHSESDTSSKYLSSQSLHLATASATKGIAATLNIL